MKRSIATILVLLMLAAATSAQQASEKERNSAAIGLGIPYGVLGLNFDIGVAPRLALSGGFGTTILAGTGYSFGAKYFLAGEEASFRPMVGVFYGTNTIAEVGFDNYKSYSGLAFCLGAQWMWGASRTSGLDLGIVLIASSGLDADKIGVEEPGKVKLLLGYRRAF